MQQNPSILKLCFWPNVCPIWSFFKLSGCSLPCCWGKSLAIQLINASLFSSAEPCPSCVSLLLGYFVCPRMAECQREKSKSSYIHRPLHQSATALKKFVHVHRFFFPFEVQCHQGSGKGPQFHPDITRSFERWMSGIKQVNSVLRWTLEMESAFLTCTCVMQVCWSENMLGHIPIFWHIPIALNKNINEQRFNRRVRV